MSLSSEERIERSHIVGNNQTADIWGSVASSHSVKWNKPEKSSSIPPNTMLRNVNLIKDRDQEIVPDFPKGPNCRRRIGTTDLCYLQTSSATFFWVILQAFRSAEHVRLGQQRQISVQPHHIYDNDLPCPGTLTKLAEWYGLQIILEFGDLPDPFH